MKTFVFGALGFLLLTFGFAWMVTRVRYLITPRHFKVILFGVCLRQIRLEDIESVSKRHPSGWSEKWWNTVHPAHRTLIIRRRRGLFRSMVITPRNRYVFKANIEKAMQGLNAPAEDSAEKIFLLTD